MEYESLGDAAPLGFLRGRWEQMQEHDQQQTEKNTAGGVYGADNEHHYQCSQQPYQGRVPREIHEGWTEIGSACQFET